MSKAGALTAIALFVVAQLLSTTLLRAQTARSGGSSAQAAAQLQQLAAERTQLQAENERLRKELETLKKEQESIAGARDNAERRVRSAQASIAASAAARDATEQELATQKSRLQELVEKFRETAEQLRAVETDRATTKQSLEERQREFGACVERNASLYRLNEELLARLERRGAFGLSAASEPFTRLKRTELENLIDDYRYRAEENKQPAQPVSNPDSANSTPEAR
jgi:chromosome segregation ATPase